MQWYVLRVASNKEEQVRDALSRKMEIEGVAGVHIMAYRQEELVAEIVEQAELLPRPI